MKVEAPRRAVTMDEVRAHRDAITRLGERFGVRNIRVFGSVARGDELGVMTQVATLRGLKLPIRDRVLREAVAL